MCRSHGLQFRCEHEIKWWDFCRYATDANKNRTKDNPRGMPCDKSSDSEKPTKWQKFSDLDCHPSCCQKISDDALKAVEGFHQYYEIPEGKGWRDRSNKTRDVLHGREADKVGKRFKSTRDALERLAQDHVRKCHKYFQNGGGKMNEVRIRQGENPIPPHRLDLSDSYGELSDDTVRDWQDTRELYWKSDKFQKEQAVYDEGRGSYQKGALAPGNNAPGGSQARTSNFALQAAQRRTADRERREREDEEDMLDVAQQQAEARRQQERAQAQARNQAAREAFEASRTTVQNQQFADASPEEQLIMAQQIQQVQQQTEAANRERTQELQRAAAERERTRERHSDAQLRGRTGNITGRQPRGAPQPYQPPPQPQSQMQQIQQQLDSMTVLTPEQQRQRATEVQQQYYEDPPGDFDRPPGRPPGLYRDIQPRPGNGGRGGDRGKGPAMH